MWEIGSSTTGSAPAPQPRAASADSAAVVQGTATAAEVSRIPEPKVETQVDAQEMQRRLQEAVRELNQTMDNASRALAFSIDSSIGVSIVTVTNKDTGEVIRQIPGEAVLNIAHSIESLKGILYSETI